MTSVPFPTDKTVVVLGAGFSRWATDEVAPTPFPLTKDFADLVAAQPEFVKFGLDTWSFERALTVAFATNPHLDQADAIGLRAAGHRVLDGVWERLVTSEAALHGASDRLKAFTAKCLTDVDIVTLNYDTLVEQAIFAQTSGGTDLNDAFGVRVSWPSLGTRVAGSQCPKYRIYKLHGSVNWFSSDPGGSGSFFRLGNGVAPGLLPANLKNTALQSAGKHQVIVPPVAMKDAFLASALMSSIWSMARDTIKAAESLVLFGYSLPPEDLSVRMLLSECNAQQVLVVNPDRAAFNEATQLFPNAQFLQPDKLDLT